MLTQVVAFGTLWFWIPLLIAGIIISEMLDNDNNGGATLVAVLTGIAVVLFTDIEFASLLGENIWKLVGFVVAFFAAGTVWAVAKWAFWLRRIKRKLDDVERETLKEYYSATQSDVVRAWREAGLPTQFPILVSEHKGKIIGWMAFWPCSMIWTIINDPVRNAFEAIYVRINSTLQRMSDNVFSDRIRK